MIASGAAVLGELPAPVLDDLEDEAETPSGLLSLLMRATADSQARPTEDEA